MADKLIGFPEYGSGAGSTVPVLASEITPGVYSLNVGADLTLDPTNLNLEATQLSVLTAAQAILAKIIAAPATSAKQDTAQTSLTAIAAALGTTADAVWTTGNGTVISLLKAIATNTIPIP